MFKYFLIYEENCETSLSEEEFYQRFTYLSYRYINIKRKAGVRYVSFHFKNNGFSKSLFYLSAKISFIAAEKRSKVMIRYEPNYFSIALCIVVALGISILPAVFVEIIKIDHKPHVVDFTDRLLIASISVIPLGFLVADIFNYYKAKNWIKKELSLECN
ncbi:hypothetical protein CLU96_3958 [Chryseobacterium sp. 52]|uniref:hypothetical protein n=1 Tax=Chryseobacterium sp. 52 TaxID=2035213 RepID=UPI000C1988C6|nr:hypothetical protein [Chryseobacterium sp. 52]PIF46912.1 hypothetical protein CLU96_3958 [Chryseobacterium sp. 52]